MLPLKVGDNFQDFRDQGYIAKIRQGFCNFTPKQRLYIMCAIGIIAIGILCFLTTSAEVVSTPVPAANEKKVSMIKNTPIMPKGYQPDPIKRDPFTAPLGVMPSDIGKRNIQAGNTGKIQESVSAPILIGIVGNRDTQVAIIQYGADSRPYRINEKVGAYQLVAIENNSVILRGADGERILTLERVLI